MFDFGLRQTKFFLFDACIAPLERINVQTCYLCLILQNKQKRCTPEQKTRYNQIQVQKNKKIFFFCCSTEHYGLLSSFFFLIFFFVAMDEEACDKHCEQRPSKDPTSVSSDSSSHTMPNQLEEGLTAAESVTNAHEKCVIAHASRREHLLQRARRAVALARADLGLDDHTSALSENYLTDDILRRLSEDQKTLRR